MKRITYFLFAFLSFCALSVAQTNKKVLARRKAFSAHSDSVVLRLSERLQGLRMSGERGSADEVVLSPYLFKVTGPAVYHSSSLRSNFSIDYVVPDERDSLSLSEGMQRRDELGRAIDDALVAFYVNNPGAVKYCDGMISRENLVEDAAVVKSEKKDISKILVKAEVEQDVKNVLKVSDVALVVEKPNFWKLGGKFGLQFTQNYVSENWYKGGNSNYNFLSSVDLYANYNNQHSIQWDNSLEMKLGFMTTTNDSVHSFLTNNDRLNLKSKLGIHAFNKFYYSMDLDARTQFLPTYKQNNPTMFARFFAPFDLSLSLGLDYKPKFKIGDFSMVLAPFSYKMRLVTTDDEEILKYCSMKDNKRSSHDFGSRAEVNLKFKLFKDFYWKSRAYYFTSYKYVESEWENTLSYAFAKYFSAELYAIWRFDDNRPLKYKDDKLGYFQFKEFFSLGLTYSF